MTGTSKNVKMIEPIGGTQLISAFVIHLVAGLILYYGLPFLETNPNRFVIILLLILLTLSVPLLFITYARMRKLRTQELSMQKFISKGVVDVLDSMTEGEGSTKAIMSNVTDKFSFMGIAARKWITTGDTFQDMIKRVGARTNEIRILLLDPNSPETKRMARSVGMGENEFKEMIEGSLKFFKSMKNQRMNVSVRLYTFMPIFRIAIVDNRLLYLGFYRGSATGDDTPQLVLNALEEVSFFKPFQEYFDTIWDDKNTRIYI